jgi:hypothetical protein
MGIFDRIGNLGKGVVGIWKSSDGPRSQDVLDAELDAAARKARVDAQLRKMKESAPEDDVTAPLDDVGVTEPLPHDPDRPIKKTL